MVKYRIVVIMFATVFYWGCATSSGVFPTGKDTYTVVISDTSGLPTSMGSLMKKAYQEANAFCESQGKVMQPISTTFQDSGKMHYELRFRALDRNDPEYVRPKLEPVPDTTIEIKEK